MPPKQRAVLPAARQWWPDRGALLQVVRGADQPPRGPAACLVGVGGNTLFLSRLLHGAKMFRPSSGRLHVFLQGCRSRPEEAAFCSSLMRCGSRAWRECRGDNGPRGRPKTPRWTRSRRSKRSIRRNMIISSSRPFPGGTASPTRNAVVPGKTVSPD